MENANTYTEFDLSPHHDQGHPLVSFVEKTATYHLKACLEAPSEKLRPLLDLRVSVTGRVPLDLSGRNITVGQIKATLSEDFKETTEQTYDIIKLTPRQELEKFKHMGFTCLDHMLVASSILVAVSDFKSLV
ncbi:hypothetical protein VNO78_21727 [Psophocarpus tetragonolobus]|uniref:Uncharacterized protein n=1 Tax=Psophocarpus tetragonolobus TaxID=3891 RepID=A0AAN9XIK7_PSOTE